MNIWVILQSCEERLPSKEISYSSLTGKKISDKEYEHVLKLWKKFEMKNKNDERLSRFVFKTWHFTVSRCSWKI